MSPATGAAIETVSAADARRLLLAGQGLLDDPARRATPALVCRLIERLGYVQVDTINVVERAHHHILMSRFDAYRPRMLTKLLERDRKLYEHWTHDASVLPAMWYPHTRARFSDYRRRALQPDTWWVKQMGPKPRRVLDEVHRRVEREGPLMSRDFEHDQKNEPWWGWKPAKAALELLWRTCDLSIAGRVNFHKVYDLTERVLPEHHDGEVPDEAAHVDWACREALARLAVATPSEIARFFDAVSLKKARSWCARALAAGKIVEVLVEAADGSKPRPAVALPDWTRRASRRVEAPSRLRLLSPFDPVIRDRARVSRLFDFDYRFEAFTPAAKRTYGYYVMPVLEGERLVGRVDPKFDRKAGTLEVNGVWWEAKVKPTKKRRSALDEAVGRLAGQIGAERWAISWSP
ncbi:MAG: winged helix-turn-helix domain-containing protein [Planctomycetota bacterium]|jgi:uncharacterized protein YcaQ